METLPESFAEYAWAPSTSELASRCGLHVSEIVRFDGNVPAWPRGYVRPGAVAGALASVNTYAHGGYPELIDAIAAYVGVGPDNIVLGNGSDDLILLCARTFAGPGDTVAVADEPTYPLYRTAAMLAGATVDSESPSVTYQCRPNNPSGALEALDPRRPLVVDEAYYEYCGDTAVDEIETGVVVLRTFSKAFGLAGARVGYAVADSEIAAELRRRQAPLPLWGLRSPSVNGALPRSTHWVCSPFLPAQTSCSSPPRVPSSLAILSSRAVSSCACSRRGSGSAFEIAKTTTYCSRR